MGAGEGAGETAGGRVDGEGEGGDGRTGGMKILKKFIQMDAAGFFWLVLALVVILVIGCMIGAAVRDRNVAAQKANSGVVILKTPDATIIRFVDYEAQVVCWVDLSSGLSCLPLAETALEVR